MTRLKSWLGWLFRPELCFGGLFVGVAFFLASLTPSLLPRSWIAQGVISGLSLVCGYGIGSAISATIRSFASSEPPADMKRLAWWVLLALTVAGAARMLWLSDRWQTDLRLLVNVEAEASWLRIGLVIVAVIVALLVLVISRIVRSGTRFVIRQVGRVVPPRISVPVGLLLTLVIVVGFAQGVLWRGFLSLANDAFSLTDKGTREHASEPTDPSRSGSPDSLVTWDSLGRMGRSFVGWGPSVEKLEEFHGSDCCEQPIRVYIGLQSSDSPTERAELAVKELERTGAFDREVIVVYTSTGTGWINPNVSDSIEYLYKGDTAQVSMQYSFLPSWISVLADESKPGAATRALVGAVRDRLDEMPESERPHMFLFGESLGSFGVESGLGSVEAIQQVSDGAMLIGPTYDNPIRQSLTANRVEGSPEWRPQVSKPEGVYFAMQPSDLSKVSPESAGDRLIYLQNSSDPVTWWNAKLLYSKPDWIDPPRAPDHSSKMRWIPVVTFWQVVGDLPFAGEVPGGHGHIFGSNVVDGWLAVNTPDGWTDAQTADLRALMDNKHG